MLGVLVRLIADAALVATAMFVPAWTLDWPRAWMLLGVMLVVRTATAVSVYRVNPELLRERAKSPMHADQPLSDRLLLLGVITTGFIALPAVAALDVFQWHALPQPTPAISALGLGVFALGWIIKGLALRANAFATTVVRLQSDREHAVADRGVYAVVRHPFYAATPLVFLGLCLWLGSFAAALCIAVPIAFIVARLVHEERFLRRELPGYSQYAERVQYRLIPGIW